MNWNRERENLIKMFNDPQIERKISIETTEAYKTLEDEIAVEPEGYNWSREDLPFLEEPEKCHMLKETVWKQAGQNGMLGEKRELSKRMGRSENDSLMKTTTLETTGKKSIDITNAVNYIKKNVTVINVGGLLWWFNGKIYENIPDKISAARWIKDILKDEILRPMADYKQIFEQLLSDSELVIDIELITTNWRVVVFQNGTYDVTTGIFYQDCFNKEDFVFSIIKADYNEDFDYDEQAEMFVKRFCKYERKAETLFFEILGQVLSNILQKKDFFLFVGVPDAGKSTVLKLIEFVVGQENYKAIPVDELAKEYTLAEIRDAKVIADDDIPCDRKINSKEISLLKTISAHGKIRGRKIFQAPMDFIPKASIVWAGNGFPKFATTEDITPLLNRMIIFPLDVAVREDEKDIHILDTLINGRSYLIGRAMQALTRLVERNFQFSEVVDVRQFYNPSKENGIMDYVNLYCEFGEQFRCGSRELYDSYQAYCEDTMEYDPCSIKKFTCYIRDTYQVRTVRTRDKRYLQGIRLKEQCDA